MEVGLKEKIKKAIDKRAEDDKFLSIIYDAIEKYDKEEIVCFDSKGNMLTKTQLEKKVIAASKRVKAGKFFTTEQLKKELDNWTNA